MSGGAKINALSAFITGNYSTSGGATLNTTNGTFTGVAPIGDPYANVSIPSYSGCNQTNFHLSGGASQTLSVGSSGVYVFCNGLNLSGGASLTLNPGIYVINGGSFNLSGGTTFNATGGVTIVLTGSTAAGYATANISGGANVSITAPTSGPTAGLAFFQDRNAPSSGTDSFSGGTTQTITGAIYFPHQAVNYSGGATAGGSNCTQLIAYTMTFSGGSYVQQQLCRCRHRRHRGRKFKDHRMRCEGSTQGTQRRSRKDVIPTAPATLIRLKTMFAATGGLAAVEFAIVIPTLACGHNPSMRPGKGSLSATAGVGSRSGGCPIRHRKWFCQHGHSECGDGRDQLVVNQRDPGSRTELWLSDRQLRGRSQSSRSAVHRPMRQRQTIRHIRHRERNGSLLSANPVSHARQLSHPDCAVVCAYSVETT